MDATKYNGWTNRETWNVNLWVTNEEPLYFAMLDAGGRDRSFTPESAADFAEELWPGGCTPDGCELAAVNWREIADAWNEE